jgi:hypothetical protein
MASAFRGCRPYPGMPGVKEDPLLILAFVDGQTSLFGSY